MDFATLRFSYLVGYFKWKDNDIRLSVTGFSIVSSPTIPSAQLEIASLRTKKTQNQGIGLTVGTPMVSLSLIR